MPVTIKIEDKVKKSAVPPSELDDYAWPGERGEGTKAFLLWMLCMLVICVGFSVSPMREVGYVIFGWWLLSVLVYFMLAPRTVLRRLRLHSPQYDISARTHPRLKTLLSKGAAMLGISEPEAFMIPEGASQIRISGRRDPHFLIITQEACDLLQAPEIDCLVLRALVHARQKHVSRLMLLQFLGDTPPPLRLLVWPVALYASLLRMYWVDAAEKTTDRLTLLLMKSPSLLLSALLKQHAAGDPIMQERNVTSTDVDNYIKQEGAIGLEGTEISTQYKLGSAIHENPYLEERITAINHWAKSSEFAEAVRKLAEARAAKTARPSAPAGKVL